MEGTPEGTFCFVRSPDGDGKGDGPAVLVALNLTAEPRSIAIDCGPGRVLDATHGDRIGTTVDTGALELRPDEALVVDLERS